MNQKPKSILPPDLNGGLLLISCKRGGGKTYFASAVENPKLVFFADFEEKAQSVNEQLKFGKYIQPTVEASVRGTDPQYIWDSFQKHVTEIETGQYTTAVIDNVPYLEQALQAEARRDLKTYVKQFGLNLANVEAGRYGGISAVVNNLINAKITQPLRQKGIKLIVVTSQVTPRWGGGGIIFNKFAAKGANRWSELSVCTLILVPGENSPVPSAIVLKEQLGKISYDEETGEFEIVRRLPYRLPVATFRAIKDYLVTPADLKNPKPGEMFTRDEIDPYLEELTSEQISFTLQVMEATRKEEQETAELERTLLAQSNIEQVAHAKELREVNKMSLPAIAKEMSLSVAEVSLLLS